MTAPSKRTAHPHGSAGTHDLGPLGPTRGADDERGDPPPPAPPRPGMLAAALLATAVLLGGLLIAPYASNGGGSQSELIPDVPALTAPPREPRAAVGRTTHATVVALTGYGFRFIDLDTSEVTEVGAQHPVATQIPEAGTALLRVGEHLLYAGDDRIWALELATGATTDLGPGRAVASAPTERTAWVLQPHIIGRPLHWRNVSIDGETLRHAAWPVSMERWAYRAGTAEVVAVPGQGIFRLAHNGNWLAVAAGTPLAANATSALILSCDGCPPSWVDVASGLPFARDLPTTLDPSNVYRLSPSGAHVLEVVGSPETPTYVYAHGTSAVWRTGCGAGWETATWSVDETLLACLDDDIVVVSDLVTGTVVTFDVGMTLPLGVAIVPTEMIRGG